MEPVPILEVTDLSKHYGETSALEHVSLAFRAGTIHAVLGENGSGKSTLVKLLSGVTLPSSGHVAIDGKLIKRFKPSVMTEHRLATVFQEVLVAPDRSVVDNILLGIDGVFTRIIPRANRRLIVTRVLEKITRRRVDLDVAAGTLPLAVQQLIVLARALVREPRILVLDEVTAALDFADREMVFITMEAFVRKGGLILFISHRMDEVTRLADHVTVLRNGHVIETLARGAASPVQLLKLMAPTALAELAHAL